MSRGLGWVQRIVLDVLDERSEIPVDELPDEVFAVDREARTEAQYRSTLRAVRSLERAGLVERFCPVVGYRGPNGKVQRMELKPHVRRLRILSPEQTARPSALCHATLKATSVERQR